MEEDKKVEEVMNTQSSNQETTSEVVKTAKVVEEPKKDKKGFCIASMVLGIIALVCFCVWYISIPCAILAIIFGVIGIKSTSKGMAVAGLVTGSIGLIVSIAIFLFLVIVGMAVGFTEALEDLDLDDTYTYRNQRNFDWYDYD